MTNAPTTPSLQLRGQPPRPLRQAALVEMVGPSPWLVAVPHDDDLVLGSGLLLGLAAAAGIEVHVAVCSDGALGYTHPEDRARIAEVRRGELEAAMGELGMPRAHAHYLGLPDGSLAQHVGARPEGQPRGLGQALAALMRELAPGAVFSCHAQDVHPDHRAVAEDTSIACFWASSVIWLELGEPVPLPAHWLYGVYMGFDTPPDLRVVGDTAALDAKLRALARFESQDVIDALVERVRDDGPEEYFQSAPRRGHGPGAYAAFFDGGSTAG